MLNPKYPYPGHYYVSQFYSSTHKGIDVVPLISEGGNHWLAPIYPVFSGRTLGVQNTDKDRGKGIKVATELDLNLIDYLKKEGYVPTNYQGKVTLEHLYWHCNEVTDLDGTIEQNVPVGITGNTGNVFAGGQPVPDNMKGVPPYPGLHLHMECVLKGENETFNLNIDPWGRINPYIILNYKPFMSNSVFVHKEGTMEYGFFIPATTPETLKDKALNYGLDIFNPDGSVNFDKAQEVKFK